MERQQIVVTGSVSTIESAVDAAFIWQEVERLGATFNRMKKEREAAILEWMQREQVEAFDIDQDNKVIRKQKSYDRFEAKEIFDALGFTDEQRAVLAGGNSAFRKGGVLDNPKTAMFHSEDMKDVLELKNIDMKRVKEAKLKKDLAERAKQ